MQHNYTCVGRYGLHFLPENKKILHVQQPWQSISLWSVADRFLSTFSFILICGSSLSRSHAENEVSRLETALCPTCQISLLSLPIRFTVGSLPPPGLRGNLCLYGRAQAFNVKPVCLPLFSQKTFKKRSLLCFFFLIQSSLPIGNHF